MSAQEPAAATFTVINVTGAGTSAYEGTIAESINTSGVIAGNYTDSNDVSHGWVRATDGTITTFSYSGAGTASGQGTGGCWGINAAGDIALNYIDSNNAFHGLLRTASGAMHPFNAPGAGTGSNQGTFPESINNSASIAGYYIDSSGVLDGFVRVSSGTITTINAPGAGTSSGQGTYVYGINASGTTVGGYIDSSFGEHGIIIAADGTVTDWDVPSDEGSYGYGINTSGTATGNTWLSGQGASRAIRATDGTTNFNASGAGTGNNQGTVGNSLTSRERSPDGTSTPTPHITVSCAQAAARWVSSMLREPAPEPIREPGRWLLTTPARSSVISLTRTMFTTASCARPKHKGRARRRIA